MSKLKNVKRKAQNEKSGIKQNSGDDKMPQGFIQKIRDFIQYHNAFVLIVVFVFFVSSVSLASENIREGVLLGKQEKEIGVDNALLLASDIESWNFEPMVLSIEEDQEYYYVAYKFKTLGVKDNIWQEILREELLKFEKESDRYTDAALYITKEIGEVIQREHQLLKDSQKIAKENGRTQRVKVVAYNGLVGKALNLKEKAIPQENPIITEEAIQIAQRTLIGNQNQQTCTDCQNKTPSSGKEAIDKDLIRKIVEEILAGKQIATNNEQQTTEPTTTPPACTPDWQCDEWKPIPDASLCGQKINQTRKCSDLNNCNKEEGKPIEAQEVDGPVCEIRQEEQ